MSIRTRCYMLTGLVTASSLLVQPAAATVVDPIPISEPNVLTLFGIGIMGAILLARFIKRK